MFSLLPNENRTLTQYNEQSPRLIGNSEIILKQRKLLPIISIIMVNIWDRYIVHFTNEIP